MFGKVPVDYLVAKTLISLHGTTNSKPIKASGKQKRRAASKRARKARKRNRGR